MHRLAHLVLSAALLGTAARSPNHDSLRSQLEPASSEVSGKLSCPGGAVPTLKSIYVRSADEGLSSWRIVLAELLVLAHMTGAALIEPCVHKSRLVACDVAQAKGYHRVLVSELFDVPALSTFATIVPPDEAPHGQANRSVCLHDFHASPHDLCAHKGLPDSYGISVKELVCESAELLVVVNYRREAISGLDEDLKRKVLGAMDFAKSAYDDAKGLAGLMGLPERFVAYHWRSEMHEDNYKACAQHLIESRDRQLAQLPSSSHADTNVTLLISDLMDNADLHWGRERPHKEQGALALTRLFDAGFVKLDSFVTVALQRLDAARMAAHSSEVILDAGRIRALEVLNRTTEADLGRVFSERMLALTFATQSAGDLGEVSVWDLILSKEADILSTCSGCQSEVCNQCAWQGHFAEFITTMRAASHGTTNTCWP